MSTQITLDKETCIDLLKRYVDSGYKTTGIISIKEGATIHKYFRILKKQEKSSEENPKEDEIFKVIFKVVELLNSNKAFTMDDAAVLDRLITFVEETVLTKVSKDETVLDPEEKYVK